MSRPMKHSGVEWLGDIPDGWKITQLKRFASVNNGREIQIEIYKSADAIPVYGSGGIFKYTTDCLHHGEAVMFGRKGTLGKPIYVNEKFWTVDTMYYLTFSDKLFAKFNYYQLVAFDWEPHITQTALPSIVASEIVSCKFAFPPLDEQQRIATFLDDKCANIDSVIEKTRASVEEYKKLKQAVITRAVTKGIRPNRMLKHSGIEWIGDIPDGWGMCRLRFLCDILTGNQDTQDNDPNGEYPFYVRSPIVERSNKYTFEGDAILMAGDGVGAGKVFHYVSGKYGCHQRVYSLQNINGIERKFLYYYLQNRFYVSIETANSKSTVDSVRLIMLKNFPIPIPPLDEQKEIAAYLDEKTSAIDSLVTKKNQLVSELESLKKSMIFEYVTGKKEVNQ